MGTALALAMALAPGALASTVTVSGGNTIRVLETGDQVNRITVSYDAGTDRYMVMDSAANLTPSGTCAAVDVHTATCPGAGIQNVSVDTGARDDAIWLDPGTIPGTVTERLDGGSANDTVRGANGPGTVEGGLGNDDVSGHGTVEGNGGNDTVVGSPAAESIRGGGGRDLLDGGGGPDDILGGTSGGSDTLVYPGRLTAISVTIGSGDRNDGGIEDQGQAGRDTVHGDIEVVVGTPQSDVLAGDSSAETLVGAAGDDTLVGNSGRDTLLGLEGNDQIFGGSGRDLLSGWLGNDREFGGPNADRVSGGPGRDLVVGNRGRDILKGKSGVDFLKARDHTRDVKIKCGRGNNRAEGATRDRHLDPPAKSC
ncbi:MAG TPA: calcium-binding protein [Solirubrobacterales bacterium]|nr:calcium-binding protein [Solirubrobacterales bacterium]